MSLDTLLQQLSSAVLTAETLQRSASEAADNSQRVALRNRELEDEVEALRQWKASASTTIQHLQQQQFQQRPPVTIAVGACGRTTPPSDAGRSLEAVSQQSVDGDSSQPEEASQPDGTAVFSPTATTPVPTVGSNDSTGSPTIVSPTSTSGSPLLGESAPFTAVANPPAPTVVRGAAETIALQREALDAARARIKWLEEELTIVTARWAAAEAMSHHHRPATTTLSTSTSRITHVDVHSASLLEKRPVSSSTNRSLNVY